MFSLTFVTESPEVDSIIKPFAFNLEEIGGFRYRARDAMRAVTRSVIREARLTEIRQEILNSKKLQVGNAKVLAKC